MGTESLNNPGVSFLDAEAWDGDIPGVQPGFEEDQQNCIDIIRHALTEQPACILETPDYLGYLSKSLDKRTKAGIPNPHKATIQYEMAKRNINENTTRVIDSHDIPTLVHYSLYLLRTHKEVWWSIPHPDDFTDPTGNQNVATPLFKHITLNNFLETFSEWYKFAQANPDSMVKVFPQDGESPALCSLMLIKNDSLILKVRPGQYSTNERNEKEKPIVIRIDLHGRTPVIILNKIEDAHWVRVFINSKRLFAGLDDIDLKGSDYVQPESMAYGDGAATEFSFITDVISGRKHKRKNAKEKNQHCPKFSPVIAKLEKAKIIIRNTNRKAFRTIDARHIAIEELHSLKNPKQLEQLHDSLREVESGDWPNNELVLRLLAQGLQGDLKLPRSAAKIIDLVLAMKLLPNASAIVRGPNGDYAILPIRNRKRSADNAVVITTQKSVYLSPNEKHRLSEIEKCRKQQTGQDNLRLNMFSMDERLSTKEILELLYLLRTGKLLRNIKKQYTRQLKILGQGLHPLQP